MTTSHICRAAAHDVVVSEHFRTVRVLTDDPLGFSAERAAQGEADAATGRTRPLTEAMHALRDRVRHAECGCPENTEGQKHHRMSCPVVWPPYHARCSICGECDLRRPHVCHMTVPPFDPLRLSPDAEMKLK